MKNSQVFTKIICVIFLVALLSPGSIYSQNKSSVKTKAENGLQKITFETPKGDIEVNLPKEIWAGDVISGTVVSKPDGKNERQITKNSNILNGYVVEVEDKNEKDDEPLKEDVNRMKVTDGILKSIIPYAGSEVIRLILKDHKGNELASTELPVVVDPPYIEIPEIIIPENFTLPDIIQGGSPASIVGTFDSDFENTLLKIGDEEISILAESPRQVFFEAPEDIKGITDISLTEGDVEVSGELNNLNLNLSADRLTLQKGDNTVVHVRIEGLNNIQTELPLDISNLTPSVIKVEGGNQQTIIIKPEDINEDGIFATDINVSSTTAGRFSIAANVTPPQPMAVYGIYPEQEIDNPNPTFMWTALNVPPDATFTFKLWNVEEFEDPKELSDFEFNPELFKDSDPYYVMEGITENSFDFPGEAGSPLGPGHVYAWQVIAELGGNAIFTSLISDLLFANLNAISGYVHIKKGNYASQYYPRGYKHIGSGPNKSPIYNPSTSKHIAYGMYKTKIYNKQTHNHIASGDDKTKIYPKTHKHITSGKDKSSVYNPDTHTHIKSGKNASHTYPKTHKHINSGDNNTVIYPKDDKHITVGSDKSKIIPDGQNHITSGNDKSKLYPDGAKHINYGTTNKSKIIPKGQEHITSGSDMSKTYPEGDKHLKGGKDGSKVVPKGEKHIKSGANQSNTYPSGQKHIISGNNKSKVYNPESNKHLQYGNDKSKVIPKTDKHITSGAVKTKYGPSGSKHMTEGPNKSKLHTPGGKNVGPGNASEPGNPNDPKKPSDSNKSDKDAKKPDNKSKKPSEKSSEPQDPGKPKSLDDWKKEKDK